MRWGAIFDLDGTLLDSNPYWDKAPEVYLATLGKKAEPDLGRRIFAMTVPQAAVFMIRQYGLTQTPEEVLEGISHLMERFYLEEVPLKPGVKTLLQAFGERGIPCRIASVTDRPLVEAALKRLGVWESFEGLLTTTEVGLSKEEPEIYLRSAHLLGTRVEETLVFEDALHAIRTAKRAGFFTVGVYDAASEGQQEEIRRTSDLYLEDFERLEEILRLVDGA